MYKQSEVAQILGNLVAAHAADVNPDTASEKAEKMCSKAFDQFCDMVVDVVIDNGDWHNDAHRDGVRDLLHGYVQGFDGYICGTDTGPDVWLKHALVTVALAFSNRDFCDYWHDHRLKPLDINYSTTVEVADGCNYHIGFAARDASEAAQMAMINAAGTCTKLGKPYQLTLVDVKPTA